MTSKHIILTVLITVGVGALLFVSSMTKEILGSANVYYQVYLGGNLLGTISDQDELYEMIDENGTSIKEEYNVDNVYPPTDLKVIATNTYDEELSSVSDVYKEIEDNDDFTILGYKVTVSSDDEDGENYSLYVLDKDIWYNATKRFVYAFLTEDEYNEYINDDQPEIVETGRNIENMSFTENITLKEEYISVNEDIYTDEVDLVQFLLFGNNPDTKSYTVKLGDTIESISDDNELNTEEFLIANTEYKSEDAVLRVGDTVNVTLIDPQLTFVYDVYAISDETVYYEKTTVTDNTKSYGYSEITTPGINGIERRKETYTVTNGERSQEAEVETIAVIQEVQDQVTTKGPTYSYSYSNYSDPVDLSGDWGWPTNKGYIITSNYGWRWGRMHEGIDISGTGFGSPIYAVASGTVIAVYNDCADKSTGYGDKVCSRALGNEVVIDHGNGYYTTYGHMCHNITVSVGQTVSKGKIIGYMGSSGSSTGTHLHFAVSTGTSTNYFNPLSLY